ncbi:MAG: hypothetical protein AAGA30_19400, partial [Planctomycetota bacterium]
PYDRFTGKFSYPTDSADDPKINRSNQRLREYCDFILKQQLDEQLKLDLKDFQRELEKGLYFESDIPQGFGLGSSGALVAALFLRYFDNAEDVDRLAEFSQEKIRRLKNALGKLEDHFHGTSSGLDPLSVLVNRPLLIKPKLDISATEIPKFDQVGRHTIFLLNTNVKRNTEDLVGQFKSACEDPSFIEKINHDLTAATNSAIDCFLNNKPDRLYQAVNQISQFHFREMPYVIPDGFADVIKEGLESQKYFLKICGAGGGGYLLGFTSDWQATSEQLADNQLEVFHRF